MTTNYSSDGACCNNCLRFSIWNVRFWPQKAVLTGVELWAGGWMTCWSMKFLRSERMAWIYPAVVFGSFIFFQAQPISSIRTSPARSHLDLPVRECLWCSKKAKCTVQKHQKFCLRYSPYKKMFVTKGGRQKLHSHWERDGWCGASGVHIFFFPIYWESCKFVICNCWLESH